MEIDWTRHGHCRRAGATVDQYVNVTLTLTAEGHVGDAYIYIIRIRLHVATFVRTVCGTPTNTNPENGSQNGNGLDAR